MVRACGSYPQCPGFNSLHRHHYVNEGAERPLFFARKTATSAFRAAQAYGTITVLRDINTVNFLES